ncbi:unnamed protein product [Effrenium voratum]|nr:unnamed protein product [Effrenium voratum]
MSFPTKAMRAWSSSQALATSQNSSTVASPSLMILRSAWDRTRSMCAARPDLGTAILE